MSTSSYRKIELEDDFDLLDLHALSPQRYPHLLESSATGQQGCFDILFAFPGECVSLKNLDEFSFFEKLDGLWNAEKNAIPDDETLPFTGGWFLYLSYELAAEIEPKLNLSVEDSALPIASATRFPAAVIRDHERGRCWIIAESDVPIEKIQDDVQRVLAQDLSQSQKFALTIEEEPSSIYLNAVTRVLGYIVEGDVFQVNLSRGWRGGCPTGLSHHSIYRKLREANPGPFNALATWEGSAIFSSSPERLVEVRGSDVQTRPIAGTRPRSNELNADLSMKQELLANPKEQAEHIMLIDLERNDLGRIAVPGSVEVDEFMTVESYATVHHIVSNVSAKCRESITPSDIIKAVFPGGTITGCPKVRCMEIIAELEETGRGAYTGSLGYLNRDGSRDLNILIRTIVREDERVYFRAGAGIVSDSKPTNELAETRVKAKGMLTALCGDAQ